MYAILKALFIKEGSPTVIQSDNGSEFIGEVVQKPCKEFEVCIVHGRPHYPQSQGQIENLNKQVKRLLARFLQQFHRDLQANVWPLLLSAIADLLNCSGTTQLMMCLFEYIREPPRAFLLGGTSFQFSLLSLWYNLLGERQKAKPGKFNS